MCHHHARRAGSGFVLAGLRLLLLSTAAVAQNLPELRVVGYDTNVTSLSVTNAQLPAVQLQGSFNLESWFPLQSATPVQGVAHFTHTNTEPIDVWYFRVIEGSIPPPLNVGPLPDINQSGGAMIYPDTGGRIEFTDANGVFYKFTAGSNLVTEPTVVRMTIITNFTNLPLTNRFRAAVAFEPDGLEFRGAAELKIRFPEAIPESEMVGFGFDGSGGDFHLSPWAPDTREVTLPVSHFSGTGVAAQPFSLTGSYLINSERANTATSDAVRNADQWAGSQMREIGHSRTTGSMTQSEANDARAAVQRLRNRKVFTDGIEPLLAAATRDCGVGEEILRRLDQLEGRSGLPYGQGPFYPTLLQLAPAVRCTCAHFFLELCEKRADASGRVLTSSLEGLLDQVAINTGIVDDPHCDLGSNNAILARMARAKCHKPWEGVVRYTYVYRTGMTNEIIDSSSAFEYVRREEEDLSYKGRLSALTAEDGDVQENGSWQSWTFKLDGKFSGRRVESEVTTQTTSNWTMTDSDVTQGVGSPAAEGEIMIRFDNGEFSSVSASAGLGTQKYFLALREVTERKVECRKPGTCPDPIPADSTSAGNFSLAFARSPSVGTKGLVATWQPSGSLKIVLTEHLLEPLLSPLIGLSETTMVMTIELFRGTGQ